MTQHITTKRLGPSNHKGLRIKATATGGCSKTISWDWGFSAEQNHQAAAKALAESLGWYGQYIEGFCRTNPHGMVYTPISGSTLLTVAP